MISEKDKNVKMSNETYVKRSPLKGKSENAHQGTTYFNFLEKSSHTGCNKKTGHPFHTGFELFLIIFGKSDEKMPYFLGLDDSFAVL